MSEAKVRVRVAHNAMHLPVVALRGLVVFPNNVVHFEVGRQKSIAAIEAAMHANSNIFLIAQKDMETEEPTAQDLYAYGVISEIKQVLRVSEDLVKVLVEGKSRAKLLDLDASGKYLQADVRPAPVRGVAPDKRTQTEALVRSLKECFEEYLSYSPQISKDVVYNIVSSDNPLYLSEYMPANLLLKYEDKQTILQENSIPSRLEKLLLVMRQECEVLAIEKELDDKVNVQMDKNQRDYYLREQMHIISEELGDAEDTRAEAEKYAQKIQDLHLDAASEEKLLKECERLGKMAGNQAEISVIRSYLDTVIGLPWHTFTKDDLNQAHARKVLDHDHYGLEKVKERILEFLAVKQLAPGLKGQILCLVGPPGVGKTSIAMSMARALNRKLARISLGGVHDEAEIRGHRKTYVGAMPGRIIAAVKQAESCNPLLLLDEIDKLGNDQRGDPASALLEVLDAEQNSTFRDHFLEVPFDLSDVLFITTANTLDTITRPLLDRMEVIELTSYTAEEKLQIAKRHLLPKELKRHGLAKAQLRLTDDAIRELIRGYTREAGVRVLERKLGVRLPAGLEITVVVFIFAAEILGEIACFYVTVPFWDKALHTTSGFIYAAVGYSMADVLNRHKKVSFELSPLFLALVAFCFSMTIGALWEIFEFSVDNLFHKDMQKDTVIQQITSVALDPTNRNIPITISNIQDVVVNGESLGLGGYLDIGLIDTMKDLQVNCIGAIAFSIIGFFYVKHRGKGKLAAALIPVVLDPEKEKSKKDEQNREPNDE